MRQTWHIFLKDARRLRYEVIVMLALTAAYAWSQGHSGPIPTMRTLRLMQAANILRAYLLPMAWWFLASLAVYGESLPGNRQFWVTRPYRWTSLLGAKLLFLVAFVSLPLLLADCFILAHARIAALGKSSGPALARTGAFYRNISAHDGGGLHHRRIRTSGVGGSGNGDSFFAGRFFGPLLSDFSEFGMVGLRVGGGSDVERGIWGCWPAWF